MIDWVFKSMLCAANLFFGVMGIFMLDGLKIIAGISCMLIGMYFLYTLVEEYKGERRS